MHNIVNHLAIRPEADWSEMAARADPFATGLRDSNPGIRVLQLLKLSDG